ncbi:hypothetical protein KR49_06445 [Synechococcus sp. KORDI-49]|nr:hypothetical protein KR49_06445 [Synechococcus sp. KORDI-49]
MAPMRLAIKISWFIIRLINISLLVRFLICLALFFGLSA